MRSFAYAIFATLAFVGGAWAHPATEQFIPIGQSPGDGTVVQGTAGPTAEALAGGGDPVVSVENARGEELGAYVVTERTRIYVDRSAQGLPSLVGTIEDVQPGRVIEVRIADPETRAAEWIKVRPN
jgi:hypothetical protein